MWRSRGDARPCKVYELAGQTFHFCHDVTGDAARHMVVVVAAQARPLASRSFVQWRARRLPPKRPPSLAKWRAMASTSASAS